MLDPFWVPQRTFNCILLAVSIKKKLRLIYFCSGAVHKINIYLIVIDEETLSNFQFPESFFLTKKRFR